MWVKKWSLHPVNGIGSAARMESIGVGVLCFPAGWSRLA